jgi:spore maturation protein CgeB
MKILFACTYYPEFLRDLYNAQPAGKPLAESDFARQRRAILDTAFGASDAYSAGLNELGCQAQEVIVNADPLQARWAAEHDLTLTGNIHDQRRQVIAAQVDFYRPDVLYVFEWCPLGDEFLAEIRSHVRLLAGQIASPLPANRTFAAYDLMISSWPPIVEHFRKEGQDAEPLRLAFDERVLARLPNEPPQYDVTFVGGFAPSHTDRVQWLERLLEEINVDIFAYGVETTPEASPIRKHYRGQAWGWKMYEVLQRSRVTLNRHAWIDVRGRVVRRWANNMRLYEATGVGTCLITENRENLPEMFEPGREVVTYRDDAECLDKIRYFLAHPEERAAIAEAGRLRTLRDHTYRQRMRELLDLLRQRL